VWIIGCLLAGAAGPAAWGGYLPPVGGWTYEYDGSAAAAGPGTGFNALDGTWSHWNGSDEWDGTVIGAGRPGGAMSLTEGDTTYLRMQETGDPRDYGMSDPGSIRKLFFGHNATADGASNTFLDDGVTLSFRARLSTTGPLDDLHPDGGGGTSPWPAGGDGYILHDNGKGNFTLYQQAGGILSFCLALSSDHASLNSDALIMNNLVGSGTSTNVDTGESGTANIVPITDLTAWHEFWINIVADTTNTGTHVVDIYMDGSLTPVTHLLTAGTGSDSDDLSGISFLVLGLGSTPQSGAMDVDFVAYKLGTSVPEWETIQEEIIPEPATLSLLGLGLLAVARRRRRR
jgi:hypothetical protein